MGDLKCWVHLDAQAYAETQGQMDGWTEQKGLRTVAERENSIRGSGFIWDR